jgi:hypothetical protein
MNAIAAALAPLPTSQQTKSAISPTVLRSEQLVEIRENWAMDLTLWFEEAGGRDLRY